MKRILLYLLTAVSLNAQTLTTSSNVDSIMAAANYAAIRGLLDLEAGTDFYSKSAADSAFQAIEATLTDIADGTITENLVNTANPWADNEVADNITVTGSVAAGTVVASGFNGNLATTDDTVQEIAQKLDDLVSSSGSVATDTIFDAAGDLVYGTGANTAARLAPGTAGQMLVMNGGATAPAWTSTPTVSSLTVTGALSAGSFEFEGATADGFETAFAVVDPTADNTLTLPNASGTVVITGQQTDAFIIAISDETTALTTGTAKVTFRAPYAFTITGVKGSLTTVSSSGTPTWDINEAGTTILSTKLTIDASEKTSATAATAAVVSDASIAADAEITIDIDTAGTDAAGGKVTIIHTH